jgi:hypothetical protein
MKPKSCEWNDIHYPSVAAAARANNVLRTAMVYRLQQGYTCDADLKTGRIPCKWNGIQYPTIRAAAQANYRGRSGMQYLVHKGYTGEEDLKR